MRPEMCNINKEDICSNKGDLLLKGKTLYADSFYALSKLQLNPLQDNAVTALLNLHQSQKGINEKFNKTTHKEPEKHSKSEEENMLDAKSTKICTDVDQISDGEDNIEEKPNHSYISLIANAILSSNEKRLVLSDIYHYVLQNFTYFRNKGPGWRNSIRHNLSLNECFVKAGRSPNGKGHYWAINPANYEDFSKGDFRRRRAQRRARRAMAFCDIPERYMHYGYHPYFAPTYFPRLPVRHHSTPSFTTFHAPLISPLVSTDCCNHAERCYNISPNPPNVVLKKPKRSFDVESLLKDDIEPRSANCIKKDQYKNCCPARTLTIPVTGTSKVHSDFYKMPYVMECWKKPHHACCSK